MIITFIGMSNIGKSYWSNVLVRDHGYTKLDCDKMIAEKLNQSNVHDLAVWMGQPGDERYQARSEEYIKLENEVMREVLAEIKKPGSEKIVVDTSGSVIYCDKNILTELYRHSNILHLSASKTHKEEMLEKYKKEPKPLIWRDASPIPDLKEGYFNLLLTRSVLYNQLAYSSIPYEEHKNAMFKDFLISVTSSKIVL